MLKTNRILFLFLVFVLSIGSLGFGFDGTRTDAPIPTPQMGRAFNFFQYVAFGVPAGGYNASPYLPQGMTGIGVDAAKTIWLESNAGYKGDNDLQHFAATTLRAASRLYGTGSAEYSAVNNAWTALNVAAASTITVTSPAGGENWIASTKHTITWSYTGSPGLYVKILALAYNGSSCCTVTTINSKVSIGSSGTGSYAWTIPLNQAPSKYYIKVQSNADTTVFDTSNTFNILAPTLTIINPAGGETWNKGSSKTIQWTYTGNPGGYVKIVMKVSGVVTNVITSSTSIGTGGNGSFTSTVPNPAIGGSCSQIYSFEITRNNATWLGDESGLLAICGTVSGPAAGGTSVAIIAPSGISGTQFNVLFGSTIASNIAFTPPNVITCKTPAGSVGTVDVSVTSSAVVAKVGTFTYY
jgi:hypothetical protein